MKDHKWSALLYCGLLAAGLLCPLLIRLTDFSVITGPAAAIWLYCFLVLTCRFRKKRELLLTGVLFVLSYDILFSGILGKTWTGPLLSSVVGAALYLLLCLSAWCMAHWKHFNVTLVLPVTWLCVYAAAYTLHIPSLVRIDMLFADLTTLLQAEQLIGSVGLSFAMLWILSMLQFATVSHKAWYAGCGFGLLGLLLLPGLVCLYPNVAASETVRIAYTTGPYVGDFMHYTTLSYEENEASLTRSIEGAAEAGAELLVFTEEAFSMDDQDEARFLARCTELAEAHGLAVLVGLDLADTDNSAGGQSVNKVVLIDGSGTEVSSYQKTHLVPIIESDYQNGDSGIPSCTLTLGGKTVKLSYLICYDSNFPAYVQQLDPDTDLLLLPSWDWSSVTQLHAKLCRALAVENQVCVLKPTYDGLSVAVTPDGLCFQSSSTDETGYEHLHLVDMPVKSTYHVLQEDRSLSPLLYAVIGTEIMSALICLLLLIVNRAKHIGTTRRSGWFRSAVATELTGCLVDALSWLLDGSVRLNGVLYVTAFLSMILTIILLGEFIAYLTEYIRERQHISQIPVLVSWIYVAVALILSIGTMVTGGLFTYENGVYIEGAMYPVYVVINILSMLIGVVIIFLYRKALVPVDRAIAYIYMLLPAVMAIVNLFLDDWTFAYPTITISLVLVYIMLQSDKAESLEHQQEIITYHATHDELTGLYNRRAYNNKTDMLKNIEGRSGIIFSDINGLKYANDHYGHAAGDQLLLRYTTLLTGIFRTSDLYRISGDEFICLMVDVPEEAFEEHIHRLEEVLAQDAPPLACIGTAFGSNQMLEALMNQAENMMYARKEIVHAQFPKTRR